MATNFRPPPELKMASPTLASEWRQWRREWKYFAVASELMAKPPLVQVAMFFNCAGREAQEVASHFPDWDEANGDLETLLERFDAFCIPRQNIVMERFKFYNRTQGPSEPILQFVAALRTMAATCEFPDRDTMLRDRVVMGVRDSRTQQALLKKSDLSLTQAIDIALAEEAASRDSKLISAGDEQSPPAESGVAVSMAARQCRFCRQSHQMARKYCPAWGKKCAVCQGMNHFAGSAQCPGRAAGPEPRPRRPAGGSAQPTARRSADWRPTPAAAQGRRPAGRPAAAAVQPEASPPADSSSDTEFDIMTTEGFPSKAHKTLLTAGGVPVTFLIDSGAECDVITRADYVRLTGDQQGARLRPCSTALRMYDGGLVYTDGKVNLELSNPVTGHTCALQCKVVKAAIAPILSLKTSLRLGLIDVKDCDPLDFVYQSTAGRNLTDVTRTPPCPPDPLNPPPSAAPASPAAQSRHGRSDIIEQYRDVFDKKRVGLIVDNYDIVTDPTVVPVVEPPRRVRIHVRDKLKKKLDELEAQGVVSPIVEPTVWVSHPVIVDKPSGDIRLCIDPRHLNKAVRREHYPTPTVDEVTARMSDAKVYSVLDAANAFWQIGLSDASARLCCFHTPFGRYIWNRLPYGVKSSPEIWQRTIHDLVSGLAGVEVIADDIVIVGRGESAAEAERDHDKNLHAFLERARARNLVLNPDKFRYKVPEIRWMGHVLTPQGGMQPDPTKVTAVNEFPVPTDVASLKRFLGMVSFLSRYIPNVSHVVAPLRALTQDRNAWEWSLTCQKAFEEVKRLLTTAPVLRFYKPTADATVQCDASSYGLGAVLLQHGQPVTYCSRSLTSCETAYSQLEKELLAIAFAMTRLDHYVYGRRVTVETDHKPLVSIMSKPLCDAPLRLQRMLLQLQRYDFEIIYRPGSQVPVADALSRAPVKTAQASFASEIGSVRLSDGISVSPQRLEAIRAATEQDRDLPGVIKQLQSGWPEHRRQLPVSLRPYHSFRGELTVQNGLLFKGRCLVVPASLQRDIIARLHGTHIGVASILRLARQNVFWVGMSAMITEAILRCPVCLSYRPAQPPEPLLSHDIPSRPWEKVAVDLFELRGSTYLLLVDYYSNFAEIEQLSRSTAPHVISALTRHFARYGLPETLVSDNGPPFGSDEFRAFLKELDVTHTTSSPRYPQSNGKVENAIRTVKNIIQKACDDQKNPFWALMMWRNTPSEGMAVSPAQRLFGRACRTFLPTSRDALLPAHPSNVPELLAKQKQRQAWYYNRKARPLPPLQLGQAVRMRLPGRRTWSPGVCVRSAGPRSYWVRVGGVMYRRNRRQLLSTDEPLPPSLSPADVPPARSERPPTLDDGASPAADTHTPTPERAQCSPARPRVSHDDQGEGPSSCTEQPKSDLETEPISVPLRRTGRISRPPPYLSDYVT